MYQERLPEEPHRGDLWGERMPTTSTTEGKGKRQGRIHVWALEPSLYQGVSKYLTVSRRLKLTLSYSRVGVYSCTSCPHTLSEGAVHKECRMHRALASYIRGYSDPATRRRKGLPMPASLFGDLAPPWPMAGTSQKATKPRLPRAGQVCSLGASDLELKPGSAPRLTPAHRSS